MADRERAEIYRPENFRPLLICLMLAMFMFAMNQTVLSTALPTIAGDLGGADRIAWIVSGFVLASTAFMPVFGSLSDAISHRALMSISIALFTLGSVAAALSVSIDMLIAARLVQGVGGGALLVLPQAVLADAVVARERAKYAGAFASVWAVASVAGPLVGGWFTDGPGWPWAFWMNVPLGVITLLLTLRYVKGPVARTRVRFDVLGSISLAGATTGVVLLATWAGTTFSWGSPQIVILFAATVACALVFFFAERRATHPVMSLQIFRSRTFLLATGSGTLAGGIAMFGVLTYLPVFLQMVLSLGATQAGLALIPMIGSILVSSSLTGIIVARTGRYKLIPILGMLAVMTSLLLLGTMSSQTTVLEACLFSALMGAGLGTSAQLLLLVVQNALPPSMVGSATAANNYFRQVGAAIGIAAIGSAFSSRLTVSFAQNDKLPPSIDFTDLTPTLYASLPEPAQAIIADLYASALQPFFLMLAPLGALSVLLLLFLERRPLSTTH